MKDDYVVFENDMKEGFGDLLKDAEVCRQIYSSLTNVRWYHPEKKLGVSYSFRAAGDAIASIRDDGGNYLDWYCSAPEGHVSELVWRTMKKRGWIYDDKDDICDEPGCLESYSHGWTTRDDGYRITCSKHYDDSKAKHPTAKP